MDAAPFDPFQIQRHGILNAMQDTVKRCSIPADAKN